MKLKFYVMVFLCASAMGIAGTQEKVLSIDDAVTLSLASDARVQSSVWDTLAAKAKTEEARRRMFPSFSVSASYSRLSDLKSTVSLGPTSMTIDSLDDVYTLAANAQYPVFTGFRLQEAVHLAEIQSLGKDINAEMIQRAVAFEAQRAYWEALRSLKNVGMLQENLALMVNNRDITKKQYALGTVIEADVLSSEMRCDQAGMELSGAVTARTRAFLTLSSIMSGEGANDPFPDGELSFVLSTEPEDLTDSISSISSFGSPIEVAKLIGKALERRPETRAASLATKAAESSLRIAKAPLYPTLNLTGNYTYANPNQRVVFQSDPNLFTGTWMVGVSLSYDIGGLPANLSAIEAQSMNAKKSAADVERQNEIVALDVRNCVLSYEQTEKDIDFVRRMLVQAKENERVARVRLSAGTASESDLLSAELARLRVEFSIVNKRIDRQIAAADVCRAAALTPIQ